MEATESRGRRLLRDAIGVVLSAWFAGAMYLGGPAAGLLWWFTGEPPISAMPAPPDIDGPPVVIAWDALVDLDDDGEGNGGETEEPIEAGPDPSEASGGDETADAVADGGADGADKTTTQAPRPQTASTGDKAAALAAARAAARAAAQNSYAGEEDAPTPGTKKKKGGGCKPSHPDVIPDGDDRWKVNRNLVDYYTANISRFNSLGWSGPYDENDLRGWKIGGFGCNSPLFFAGLRRGDIVLSVNDKPTRTWLQIFGAWQRLRRQDEFEVVLVRKGQQQMLRYSLFDGGPPHT